MNIRIFLCDFMKLHKCITYKYDKNKGQCEHCGRECIRYSNGKWVEKLNRQRYFRRNK